MFRIRIDIVNDLNSDQLIEVCESEAHVVVRHELPHGNPHFHAWIKTSVKENTIRQRLKRKFGFLKSSDYSIKKCDEERTNEYVQYMFNTKHGNKWELIDTYNFDNQLLDTLKENAQKVADDYADAKSKPKTNTGPTIWELAMETEELFKQRYDKTHCGNDTWAQDRYEISTYTYCAVQTLRKHKKAYCEFLVSKIITTAMTSNDKGMQRLCDKMEKKFLPV